MNGQIAADERALVQGTLFHIFQTVLLDAQHSNRCLRFECALCPLLWLVAACCAKSALQHLAKKGVPGH